MNVLFVAREISLAVRETFRMQGIAIDHRASAEAAFKALESEPLEAVVVAYPFVGLHEEMNTHEFIVAARSYTPMPLVVYGTSAPHQLMGFYRAGADRCLPSSIDPGVFALDLIALLRRAGVATDQVLRAGDLAFDRMIRKVTVGGREVVFSRYGLRYLEYLMQRPGRVLSRDEIMQGVYGSVRVAQTTVDVSISRVRTALAPNHPHKYIETVRGEGYRFRIPDQKD